MISFGEACWLSGYCSNSCLSTAKLSSDTTLVCTDMHLMSLQQHVVLPWCDVSLMHWLGVVQPELLDPLSCTRMIHCATLETCWLGCIKPQRQSMSIFLHCSSAAQRLVSQKTFIVKVAEWESLNVKFMRINVLWKVTELLDNFCSLFVYNDISKDVNCLTQFLCNSWAYCDIATDELVQEALGHITEGICRPLKVVTLCWSLLVWGLSALQSMFSWKWRTTLNIYTFLSSITSVIAAFCLNSLT